MKKEKNMLKNEFLSSRGITLIALVITIIVLLILAAVSIATLTGENGILTQARKAQEETKKSNELEEVKLAINAGISENLANNTEINEAIRKELVKTDENATVTGGGTQKDIKYKNNMYTVDIKLGQVEQMTEEEFAKRSIKIKVNTGDDGKVVLPIRVDEECTIDWGDGVTTGSKKENVKMATIGEIKLAELVGLRGYTHIYEEKNVERTVTIKGSITTIFSYYCTKDADGNEYEKGLEKIIEIEQWGETGLSEISLSGLSNLTKIALPSKNSFIGVDNFNGAFAYCTKLESIPEY